MKTPTNRRLVPILLAAAIVVVLANAWFAFRSVHVLLNNEQWVQHTWQVIYQVERVMGSTKDAETGNRGFLITGDDAYLEPYFLALKELPKNLDQFGVLTADNPAQREHLVEMRSVLEHRLSLLSVGIEQRRRRSADTARIMAIGGTGKADMDHLRQVADAIEAEERRLLALRTVETASASRRAYFSVGLASVLDLLLLLAMFRYFARERRLRLATESAAEGLAVAHAETEAKAAEVNLLNETLELRVQSRTAELETTNRELEAFSYSVSHDLRSPLRTIDGFSQALEEDYAGSFDATGLDYLRRVRAGVQRMGELIDALLQLSRITRAEITREEVNMSAIAEMVIQDLKIAAGGRTIQFSVEPNLHVNADRNLIQVALENLLGNAVKFSGKVSDPTVEFGLDEVHNAFFVRDNGAGFDMYYADKLFNAFNRLHGDKDFKGSGIGLATVARVIRRHHGRIWADSTVDQGATFWFTLG